MSQKRPYVSFAEVKQQVSIPAALERLGLLDRFTEKRGAYTGICPLPEHQHGPRPNPKQFKFDNRKGTWLWRCFGDCDRGGDVIELVKAIKQLSDEHVRFWFADEFGLGRTQRRSRGDAKTEGEAVENSQATLAEAVEQIPGVAQTDFPQPLRFFLNLDGNAPYLSERGIESQTIERYGIGLCSKGVLKGYLAIPVFRWPKEQTDEHPVGYIGRWPGDDYDEAADRPRYKIPSGFEVSRMVYGLNEALDEANDSLPLIVVEGAFKVWHLFQCGYRTAVSTLTSSMSDEQADILASTGRPIVLLFDGNEAGRVGMRKAAGKLITRTFVRVVKLGEGKEPDSLVEGELDQLIGFAMSMARSQVEG